MKSVTIFYSFQTILSLESFFVRICWLDIDAKPKLYSVIDVSSTLNDELVSSRIALCQIEAEKISYESYKSYQS